MNRTIYSEKLNSKAASAIHGNGSFAIKPISEGEFLFTKGGHCLPKSKMFSRTPLDCYWPISDDHVLAPKSIFEVEKAVVNINHSCNPNCGIRGQDRGVAIRNIAAGEEIVFDYAMLDNELNWFYCNCKQPGCRKIITSIDWKITGLQKKYSNNFASYLRNKIEEGQFYSVFYDIQDDIHMLRVEVFIDEQGISKADEFEGCENDFIHCCLYKKNMLIACARVSKHKFIAQIGRVAVKKQMRKFGYGREIMFWAEIEAMKIGCTSIVIHAQVQVEEFYKKIGYKPEGEVFIEAGIPHIKMTKSL